MPASRKTLRIEAILWLAVTAVAILLSVLLLIRNATHRANLQTIQAEKEQLTAQVADLSIRCEQHERQAQSQPGLSPWEIEELRKKGLKDPVADLIADLQKHPELIPHEGVLGGTMAFGFPEKIYVLTKHYVLAYFEDGHIGGWMVLEYSVARGRISWRVVDSHLG